MLLIPPSAFGAQPGPEKGNFIETLREDVYAIGEGKYLMMATVAPVFCCEDANDKHLRRRHLKSPPPPHHQYRSHQYRSRLTEEMLRDESNREKQPNT